jgi:transcriptional regulator EpsA
MATEQSSKSGSPAALPVRQDHLGMDSRSLGQAQAQALLHLIETAPEIKRRSQFFTWTQTHLHVLVPHVLAVCGAYDRRLQRVGFDVFNSSVMPRSLIDALTGNESPLMNRLVRAWIDGQGRPLAVELGAGALNALGAECAELGRAGLTRIAVHGVARPSRTHEIETFFLFGDQAPAPSKAADSLHHFELLMPHLHATYMRTQALERELAHADRGASTKVVERVQGLLSKREREIIQWVREGKTNQQIGDGLGISALTVKNHVQSILRKLGASNRAQAVATAMNNHLMSGEANRGDGPSAPGASSDGVRKS